MYRIAVCEDEPIFLKYISEMTVDILSSIGESCEIWKYTSALGLESALQEDSGAYDILILDIMLGEINGVSFMEYLPGQCEAGQGRFLSYLFQAAKNLYLMHIPLSRLAIF